MGHVTNPISYRLGSQKKWLSGWFVENKLYKIFLQEDFLLYRIIKALLMHYSQPVFELKEVRNPKSTPKVAVSGNDNIIPSPFVESSFAFSHVEITRAAALGIQCYFMDSLLENWRRNVVKQPNLTSSRIFKPVPKKTFLPYFLTQLRSNPKLQTINTQWKKFRNFAIKKRLKKWVSKYAVSQWSSRYGKSRLLAKLSLARKALGVKYLQKDEKIPKKAYRNTQKPLGFTARVKLAEIRKQISSKNAVQILPLVVKKTQLKLAKKLEVAVSEIAPKMMKKAVAGKKPSLSIRGIKSATLKKQTQPTIVNKGLKIITPRKVVKKVSLRQITTKLVIGNKKRILLKRFPTYDNKRVLKIFRHQQLVTINKKINKFRSKHRIINHKESVLSLRKKVNKLSKRAKKRYLLRFKKKKFAKAHPEMQKTFNGYKRKRKVLRRLNKNRLRTRRIRRRRERILLAKAKRKKWRFMPTIQNDTELKMFPLSLYQLIFQAPQKLILPPAKRIFKLLKILLLMLPAIIKYSKKKQVFFVTTLRQSLMSLFALPFFSPKMLLVRTVTLLFMKENSFKHTRSQYFKKIISNRFLIFQGVHSAIISAIKSFDKNSRVVVSFFGMHMGNLSASLTCNYIIYKLGQYFSIQEIFRNLLRDLRRAPNLSGFRIVVAGRLTRKERAAYLIRQKGRLDLSAKTSLIDYASDFKIMRFGVVGVKIWLNQRKFTPTYYVFKFATVCSKSSSISVAKKELHKHPITKKIVKSVADLDSTENLENKITRENLKIVTKHNFTPMKFSDAPIDFIQQGETYAGKYIRHHLIKRDSKTTLCRTFVRHMRQGARAATNNMRASEVGTWRAGGLFSSQNMAYGQKHEVMIDSTLRTDPNATQSNNTLSTKAYAHQVDPAITETTVISENQLAKGGKGIQYMNWRDHDEKVTPEHVKNEFEKRRDTTPEEDRNFQASKNFENTPVYRNPAVTKNLRFSSSHTLKPMESLAEKEKKKLEFIKKND